MPSQRQLLEDEIRQTQARLQTNQQLVQELRQGEITAGVVEAAKARVEIKQREEQIQDDLRRLDELEAEIGGAAGAGLEAEPECLRLPFEPEMVFIPASTFLMGSLPGGSIPDEETDQHTVFLPNYFIGKKAVTNDEFWEFLHQEKRPAPPTLGWEGEIFLAGQEEAAVTGVTWEMARDYCTWLSKANGRGRIYVLPHEAEWEKAARGPEGRIFPWGDDPQAGGPNQPSYYGCLGMAGGVREWTRSLWGKSRRQIDPANRYPWQDDNRHRLDAPAVVRRIYRGSAADEELTDMRCARRRSFAPDQSGDPGRRFGFRVVMRTDEEELN